MLAEVLKNAVRPDVVEACGQEREVSRVSNDERRVCVACARDAARRVHCRQVRVKPDRLIAGEVGRNCPAAPAAADVQKTAPFACRQRELRDWIAPQPRACAAVEVAAGADDEIAHEGIDSIERFRREFRGLSERGPGLLKEGRVARLDVLPQQHRYAIPLAEAVTRDALERVT